jgi:hypothetical protein
VDNKHHADGTMEYNDFVLLLTAWMMNKSNDTNEDLVSSPDIENSFLKFFFDVNDFLDIFSNSDNHNEIKQHATNDAEMKHLTSNVLSILDLNKKDHRNIHRRNQDSIR